MGKCELCGTRFSFKNSVSKAFGTLNGIEGYYPAQPYKNFNCADSMICDNCYIEIARTLGIANCFTNERIWDKSVIERNRQALINKRPCVKNPNLGIFLDYVIEIGERLIKGESDEVLNGRKIARNFVKKKYPLFLKYKQLFDEGKCCKTDDGMMYLYLAKDYLFYSKICFNLFEDNQEDNEFYLYRSILNSFTFKKICEGGLFLNSVVHPIAVSDILYFCHDGEIYHDTVVKGGGGTGGGINTSGALLGGLLFGGIGAIIGAQAGTEVKIEPVHSNIQITDTRKTLLVIRSGNIIQVEEFSYNDYDAFLQLIPQKEREYVLANPSEISNITPPPPIRDELDDEELEEIDRELEKLMDEDKKEKEDWKRKNGWYD